MSITTYTELQTAITNWLGGRTDLTTYYPDWIRLFESEANRRLRLRQQETTIRLDNNDVYTRFCLHFDGDDASTNIIDSARGGLVSLWAANGSAALSTSQKVAGTASLSLTRSASSYVGVTYRESYTLGSDDFTIELWFKQSGTAGSVAQGLAGQVNSGFSVFSWYIYMASTGYLEVGFNSDFGTRIDSSTIFASTDTDWHHVATVREGDEIRLYIDGILEGRKAYTGTIDTSSLGTSLGRNGEVNGSYFDGYIDEFRLDIGVCRYSADFIPGSERGLPADYLAYRRVTWPGNPLAELEYVHPDLFQSYYPTLPSAPPRIFTIEGNTLKIMPVDYSPVALTYYRRLPSLASNDTNWLLSTNPDLYLFGALAEAGGFVEDGNQLLTWKARRDEIFDGLTKQFIRERSAMAARPLAFTP